MSPAMGIRGGNILELKSPWINGMDRNFAE